MTFHAIHLTPTQVRDLEYEVIPTHARTYLTRLLRRTGEDAIYSQNELINRVRTIANLPIYVLEADDLGDFHPAEHAWHRSEFEVALRRIDAAQFIDLLAEIVKDEWISCDEANDVLEKANSSARIREALPSGGVTVEVVPVVDLNADLDASHPNVRALVARMDRELAAGDNAAVLHTSASIFETAAKEIIGTAGVANATLGGFFERYRKESSLPQPVLDYIKAIYGRRNTEPLAGHGQLEKPSITRDEAEFLAAVTKAFIVYESRMSVAVGPPS